MRDADACAVKLSDYRPPDWLIDSVHLDFRLERSRRLRRRAPLMGLPIRPREAPRFAARTRRQCPDTRCARARRRCRCGRLYRIWSAVI